VCAVEEAAGEVARLAAATEDGLDEVDVMLDNNRIGPASHGPTMMWAFECVVALLGVPSLEGRSYQQRAVSPPRGGEAAEAQGLCAGPAGPGGLPGRAGLCARVTSMASTATASLTPPPM
jgi:hypothetical protein